MDISSLPFNKLLGVATDGDSVVLTPRLEHTNHVGTVHATVIFGIAEIASGVCLLDRFPRLGEKHGAVLRSSSVKFRRPGIVSQGDEPSVELRALGAVDDSDATDFLEKLASRGRATIDVAVTVTQSEERLFTGSYTWFAARKDDERDK